MKDNTVYIDSNLFFVLMNILLSPLFHLPVAQYADADVWSGVNCKHAGMHWLVLPPQQDWLTAVWPVWADLYVFRMNHLVDLPNPCPTGIISLLLQAQIC